MRSVSGGRKHPGHLHKKRAVDNRPYIGNVGSLCRGGSLPPAGEHSSPLRSFSIESVGSICDRPLRSSVQHVFDEDTIAGGWIIDQDMSNGAYQFSVLYNR